MKKSHSIILALVLVLIVAEGLFLIGQNSASEMSGSKPQELVTYSSESPEFSFKHPESYVCLLGKNRDGNNVQVLECGDSSNKLGGVILRIMDKGDAQDLEEWIGLNVTSAERGSSEAEGYLVVGVTDLNDVVVAEQSAKSFLQPTTVGNGEGALLIGDDYVYAVLHIEGQADSAYQTILKSLNFK